MICPECAHRADTSGQCTRPCKQAVSCTCQHDHPWEQDPDGRPEIPAYIDGLEPNDPRRLAYEKAQHRRIDG